MSSAAQLALATLLLLLLCCSSSLALSLNDIEEKGAVQVLTSSSWEGFRADLSKPLVVLHYAPWCGHCKRLLPDFEVASRRCASAVIFSKVDCTKESSLCSGVNAYPHIKIHLKHDGTWTEREYDGEHTADALELLCTRLSSPAFTTLARASALEKQSAAFAIDARDDSAGLEMFHSVANEFYHIFSFFVVDGLLDLAGPKVPNASSTFAVKSGVLFRCSMSQCGSRDGLVTWIKGNSMPVMPAITSGNWHRLSRSKFVVVAVSHPSDADAERTLRWVQDVALEFERQKFHSPKYEVLQFALLDGQEWSSFASRFTKANGAHGVEVFITDTANAGSISVPVANATDAAALKTFLDHVVAGDVSFSVGWTDWFKKTLSSSSSIAAFITIAVAAIFIYRPARPSIDDRIKALREMQAEEPAAKSD